MDQAPPKKMAPGDDMHLTLLMAPHNLNLVTGQDRQHLLAFGRAAFEAGKAAAAAQQGVQPEGEHSATYGMNIAKRILHVGGRENAQTYIEFGSVDAVRALVGQVLRDLPNGCPDFPATHPTTQGAGCQYVFGYGAPAEGVPAQAETLRAELAEATEAADNWRRLALQFDNHRMQALGHLRQLVRIDDGYAEAQSAEQFLAAPPLDGEAVLAQRIAALAAATQPAAQGLDAQTLEAMKEAESVLNSINTGKQHRVVQADGEVTYWQREEWCKWATGEVLPKVTAALAAQAKQGGV